MKMLWSWVVEGQYHKSDGDWRVLIEVGEVVICHQ